MVQLHVAHVYPCSIFYPHRRSVQMHGGAPMCLIALAHNPMILHRGSYRFPVAALMNKAPPKYIIGVPCWLAYCTSDAALNSTTTDLRIGRGGHPVWPVPT
jgi:hypothetical protein